MRKNYNSQGGSLMYLSASLLCMFVLLMPGNALAQRINLKLSNITVKEAVIALNRTTNYSVAIKSADVDMRKIVSVSAIDAEIRTVLDQIFVGQNVNYSINGNSITVSKAIKKELAATEEAATKTHSVTGVIVDEHRVPLIGVTVMVEGANIGGLTDLDGKFTINNVKIPATIQCSYVGYTTQNIHITDLEPLKLTLREAVNAMEEVVVVGYGTQKRVNLTGAVGTISGKNLNERPVVSAAGALQGADPSVNISFSTGSPESGYNINVRGALSINKSTPLVLVDGVQASLNQVNPNDIESVSVLKDASSCAIYGAKASAGVVLITTKSGGNKDGKAVISYNGRYGIAQNTTSTDFITTGYDQVVLTNRFYNSYNGIDMYQYTDANGGLQKLLDRRGDKSEHPDRPWTEVGSDGKYYYYGNFDWYNYFYNNNRSQQEHNLSVTGGTEKFNYYASGRILSQDGIFNIKNDTYDNISFRTKMSAKIKPWLKYSNNVSFDKSTYSYAGRFDYNHTIAALQSNISSSFLPRNPDGSIVQYVNQLYANSPLGAGHGGFLTANTSNNTRTTRYLTISNQVDIDITKGLTLTGSYSYDQRDRLYSYRNNLFSYSRKQGVMEGFSSGSVENSYQEVHRADIGQNINIFATYNHTWNQSHNFTAVAGGQYEDNRWVELDVYQKDLTIEDLSSFAIATGIPTVAQDISAYKTFGVFARFNYDYKGRYLLEFSSRYDGTSRFEQNRRWSFTPSASAGWRVSEEKFFRPIKNVVNNLKARFSYGILGNQQVSDYYYIDKISIDNQMKYTFDSQNLAYYANVSAPLSSGLTWERATTYNAGIDIGLFDNRLSLSADYYIRDTKDMLAPGMTLPSVFGEAAPKENSTDLRTKGWEIVTGWEDGFKLSGRRFTYGVSASLGDYVSKITKFDNPTRLISDHYVGKTLGEIWGYRVAGLFKTDKEAAEYQARYNDKAVNQRVYNCKGPDGNYLRAGDVRFIDLTNDNIISEGDGTVTNPGDKRIIGNSLPRYSYSFRLNFGWYGFDVSAFFQGVGRMNWYPASNQSSYDFWGPYAFPSTSFIHKDFESNCWSEDNRNAYFPRQRGYQAYSGGSLGEVNDRYLQDVSYLRFKNLNVGYTIPLAKKYIDKIRVYFSGENLWYWSPLKKYNKTIDPELTVTSGTYNNNSGTGYAYSRTFSFGATITF